MNAWLGTLLALLAVVVGGVLFGWQGAVFALSGTVFWLLLEFTRLMRVMRRAAAAPVGHVQNAVMFHAKLHGGMKLVELLALTGSLGQKLGTDAMPAPAGASASYVWQDGAGDRVEVHLADGRLQRWALLRAEDSAGSAEPRS